MQFRRGLFDLLFYLAQREAVCSAFIPINFVIDNVKIKTMFLSDKSKFGLTGT